MQLSLHESIFNGILYLLFVVLSLSLVLGTASVYFTENPEWWILFVVVSVSITLLYSLISQILHQKAFRFSAHEIIFSLYYIICVCLLYLFWGSATKYFVYIMCILFPILFFCCKVLTSAGKIQKFINVFVTLCMLLGLVSLIFWASGSILHLLKPSGSLVLNWGGEERTINSYWNLYFEPQNSVVMFGGILLGVRNSAIFAEAPMACFVFSAASTLNELYIHNKVYRVVLLITILSTLTTTGFIFSLLSGFAYLRNIHPRQRALQGLKILISVICCFVVIVLIAELLQQKGGTGSGTDRSGRILEELHAFSNSPFVGWGFDKFTNGSSNSFAALLADGGILLWSIFYSVILMKLISLIAQRQYLKMGFVLSFTFVFAINAVQYTPILIFIITVFSTFDDNFI